jgi:hypothetical protein
LNELTAVGKDDGGDFLNSVVASRYSFSFGGVIDQIHIVIVKSAFFKPGPGPHAVTA